MKLLKIILALVVTTLLMSADKGSYQMALLKYNGGGDWYANPTSLPNLVKFCNENIKTDFDTEVATVDVGSKEIFKFPFVHLTGHGNILFSPADVQNLRLYLTSGGFLHISDNYGLDQFIRREMKKVFPESDFVELPFNHPIYKQKFVFNNGLPKIHEHDKKPSQGFGIIHNGRLVVFYDYECDLGDGWEDADVHKDSPEKRRQALQMGANIVKYALEN